MAVEEPREDGEGKREHEAPEVRGEGAHGEVPLPPALGGHGLGDAEKALLAALLLRGEPTFLFGHGSILSSGASGRASMRRVSSSAKRPMCRPLRRRWLTSMERPRVTRSPSRT